VLEQAPIMPTGTQADTQPENAPLNLEAQGRRLAEDHQRSAQNSPEKSTNSSGLSPRSRSTSDLLTARLPIYTKILKEAASRLQAQTSQAGQLTPTAEWFLDNHHVASQAVREVQQDLPPKYERQLPRLP
jgi:hypothetical protein